MTTPRLAINTGYGRLYRLPSTPAENVEDWRASVESGLLVPSVTNVIGVMDKPYLQAWHAKLAAEEAVAVVMEHPNLVAEKPEKAQKWFKEAAKRYTEGAADIGDRVHDSVERLSRGEEDFTADEDIEAFVTSWKKFVKEFEPEFLHLEATCYGWVPADDDGPPLGYAGTADFIARIRGKVVVGDYKSGKAVHTEAGIQLSSLAHAEMITLEDDSLVPMPAVDGGIAVHLRRSGFSVYPVTVDGVAWDAFCKCRRLWNFHAENLHSRAPLLLGSALSKLPDAGLTF